MKSHALPPLTPEQRVLTDRRSTTAVSTPVRKTLLNDRRSTR
jgi:hypothetical protein